MPKTIRSAIVLLWIQFAFIFLTIIAAFVTISVKAEQGFWLGFQNSIAARAGASSLSVYGPTHAGSLLGLLMFPLIFSIGSLWSISRRWFRLFLVFIVLSILGTIGQHSFPLLSIIIFCLVISFSGRGWMKGHDVVVSK
jgi:hypothetical protein